MELNNLFTRTITAIGFVAVMVGSMILGQQTYAILMLIVTYLGLHEFYTHISKQKIQPAINISVWIGLIVYSIIALNAMGWIQVKYLLLIIPLLFIPFILELWRKKEQAFLNIAVSLLGILYIALPLGLTVFFFNPLLPNAIQKAAILLGFITITWINDSGAYIIGSAIGKHKLFERISPKKTWEGTIGGVIVAVAFAYGISLLFTQLSSMQWIILAVITIITATLGDLIESMFKRSIGIKDSGNILPGHGGILDRFDAMLLSTPFVFIYLVYFCQII